MHANSKRKALLPEEAFLKEDEIRQEIIIRKDGRIEVPWITPKASAFVLALWEDLNRKPFPVTVLAGNIYCG